MTRESTGCTRLCSPATCTSCALDLIQELTELLQAHNSGLGLADTRDTARAELLRLVDSRSQQARDLLRRQTLGQEVTQCDAERSSAWERVK